MPGPAALLGPEIVDAIVGVYGDDLAGTDPVLRPSEFADVQANCALALAKSLKTAPRAVAQSISDQLLSRDLSALASVEVSGPGFLNFTFDDAWLAEQAGAMARDARLGVAVQPREVVPIDYSSPNVAKEMHVGHLRTTIVGDCLARVLEHLGHTVVRQNHIGDWGTPFGMLIEHLRDVGSGSEQAALLRSDPNAFYQAARAKFDAGAEFADRARRRVVLLQAQDADTLAIWHALVDLSKGYFNRVYSVLGVTLRDDDLAGESTYNAELAGICDELQQRGIARVSDGALCVFLPGYAGRDGEPLPLIVRKSDGGYGYATTDLATIRRRVRALHASRILYVVGATQALHFQMVWETARLAGWLPQDVPVVHVQIGSVLGTDRKLLRTRSGESLRLLALLDEAVERARAVLDTGRGELSAGERALIAPQIGIGAVKYADLSVAHDTDYVFDLDRMVSFTGNTGPYLQYAAARIRSILRNAGVTPEELQADGGPIAITGPDERELVLALLDFGDVVAEVGARYEPHRLCAYLHSLAQRYARFYESSPVLAAQTPDLRASRLRLVALTLAVLVQGLDLLGIQAPERM